MKEDTQTLAVYTRLLKQLTMLLIWYWSHTFMTEFHKYTGPIYASTPTKAMIPYMLEDFRKVTSDVKK